MKKVLLVAVLAISTTAGCVSSESIRRSGIKEQHGKAAFADPVFSNSHYNEQYAKFKKLKKIFDRSGKLPVNWSEFEKCKLSTKAAAGIVTPHLYSDSEKWTKIRAQLASAYKNIKLQIKPKKGSLAKHAQMAKMASTGTSRETKQTLKKAEVYALKGQCANAEVLAKSKTRQIRIISTKIVSKATFTLYGKKHITKDSYVNHTTSLFAGTGADETQNIHPKYSKNNPRKGISFLSTSSAKSGRRRHNSSNLMYGHYFNNGNSISFSITGGSISTRIVEQLSDKRFKYVTYQGSKRTSVTRWKNGKRHGLQMSSGLFQKGSTCYVNGVKSYKTDCERF